MQHLRRAGEPRAGADRSGHATRNPGLASGFRGATVGWAVERLVSDGRGALGGTVGGTSAQRRAAGDRLRR
jgi:hypothetical protein